MSKEELVLLDTTRDGIAVVTMNRPEIHNAFSALVIERFDDIFEDLHGADGIRAVVLRARGRSFSAGADLNWMRAAADYSKSENEEDSTFFSHMLNKLNTLPQVTIAAVQGPAVGGGTGLIAACDVAIGVESSWFCFSEVKLGLIPAVISPYVVEAIGPRAARRYFTTAERFDAAEAHRLGLLHEVVENEMELDRRINEIIEAVFQTAPGAVADSKDLIRTVNNEDVDKAVIVETAKRIAARRASDEGKEGTSAFLEKREAEWVRAHNELVKGGA